MDNNKHTSNVVTFPQATAPALQPRVERSMGSDALALLDALAAEPEPARLVRRFTEAVAVVVPHDGYRYQSPGGPLLGRGIRTRFGFRFNLGIGNKPLGELQLFRRARFSDEERQQLRELTWLLLYPLFGMLYDEQPVDPNPRRLRRWLEELPLANVGESARQLFRAMVAVNRGEFGAKPRLSALEMLVDPLAYVSRELRTRVGARGATPDERGRHIVLHALTLHHQITLGYRRCLSEVDGEGWLARRLHRDVRLLAAHRLLEQIGDLIGLLHLAGMHEPEGLWREVHRLHRDAVAGGYAYEAGPGVDSSGSVEQAYLRTLLFARLSPRQVGADRLELVRERMVDWLDAVRLVPARCGELSAGFCVDAEEDRPAHPAAGCAGSEGGHCIHMDTTELRRRLEEAMHEPGPGVPPPILQRLIGLWCDAPNRRDQRLYTGGRGQVVIGLSAVCHLLSRRHRVTPLPVKKAEEGFGFELEAKPEAERRDGDFMADHDGGTDVWEMVYSHPGQERNAWSAEVDADVIYAPIAARIVDRSESGCRLALHTAQAQRVRVGDLVGFRAEGGGPWRVGNVRWLEEMEKEVALGVQFLLDNAEPASVSFVGVDGNPVTLAALTGAIGSDAVVLLPRLPHWREVEPTLNRPKDRVRILLGRRAQETPSVEAYVFREVAEDVQVQTIDSVESLWRNL